jgi:ubiquinone/menaquinone biosynthesis C-methylase UbiE
MDYHQKYYKYKQKYINLQNTLNKMGGGEKYIKPYITVYDKMLQKLDKDIIVKQILKICAKNKLNPSNLSIMDMGCGHGIISLGLTYYFKKVIAIDQSVSRLEEAELYKKRLKFLQPKYFNEDKITFIQNNFYKALDIKPVNIILLSNSIHFAELNTVNNVLDNLLNYLVKGGLVIISEPWTNSIFGIPILNQDNDFRKNELEKIKNIREEIDTFIEKSSKVKLIKSKNYKNDEYYIITIKKII